MTKVCNFSNFPSDFSISFVYVQAIPFSKVIKSVLLYGSHRKRGKNYINPKNTMGTHSLPSLAL